MRPSVPRSTPAKHIHGLDLIRFVSAVLVMLYHIEFWQNGVLPARGDTFRNTWWFGWIGVEVFFVLSGFVIAYSAQFATAAQFAKSRFLRLMPGVWICATVTLLVTLIFEKSNTANLFKDYFHTLALVPVGNDIDVVYWTLKVEVSFYFIVFLVLYFSKFSRLIPIMMAIGLWSLVFNFLLFSTLFHIGHLPAAVGHLVLQLNGKFSSRLVQLNFGCFFTLGVVLWKWVASGRSKVWTGWLAAFFAMCTATVVGNSQLYVYEKQVPYISFYLPLAAWTCLVVMMIYFVSGVSRSTHSQTYIKVTRFLGLMTYPLYLLHSNCGLIIRKQLMLRHVPLQTASVIAMLTAIAAAAVVVTVLEPAMRRAITRLMDGGGRFNPPMPAAAT